MASDEKESSWKFAIDKAHEIAGSENKIPEELGVSTPYKAAIVQPSKYERPNMSGPYGEVGNAIYDNLMSQYNTLASKFSDQTDEAKAIRKAWETAPTVSIENGRLKLSGSKSFLQSAEAKQLRKTLKSMEGGTYNTEDLNRQIEAWNSTLSEMSKQYIDSLGTLNAMNASLANTVEGTTREGFQKYLTFSDLQKISNSAAVGRQQDARTTKNKIFVGYEWDDKGNMKEKWVDAADFFNEFNGLDDDAKRSAYHSLTTRANLGDVGAYSKLMYLQGGSESGPANVDIDGTGTFFEEILRGAEAGAAGVLQDILDYAPILNLRTVGGNIANVAENADERNFWDWAAAIMAPGLYANKYDTRTGILKIYNDAVTDFNNLRDWSNTYTSELNPGSTALGRTIGDVTGGALRIAGDLYAFGKLGQLAADTKFAAMQIANQKFAGSKGFTPLGQIYIRKPGAQVVNQVTPLSDRGGVMSAGTIIRDTTTVTPFGGIYVPTVLTKISPKFTQFLEETALAFTEVQFARSASQFISKDGTTILQFGTATPTGARMTWTDGVASGQGGFIEPAIEWGTPKTFTSGSNIKSAWETFSSGAGQKDLANGAGTTWFTSGSKELSNILNYSRSYELLKTLRNKDSILGISKGIQTAQALSNLVGFSAMRNVDEYFHKVEAGENVGDMSSYVISHTAEDAVWGGLILKAGGFIKYFKRGADASAKPAVEYVQEIYDGATNSQSSWYTPNSYMQSRFTAIGPGESYVNETTDLTSLLSSIMTVNGEALTGFSGELGGVSAVPGTNIKEAGKALGVYSPSKVTKLSVQPANGGAYLIREETNLLTNTKTETRQFYTDLEEATKAAGVEAVPKTSPKTLENSDEVKEATVAPLTYDGKAPNVMPDGVSQVRVQPGIVYRTPDNIVESLINIAAQEGWHESNQDRLYWEYEQAQKQIEAQQNAMEILSGEMPNLPREMYGTDIDALIRLAAAAKVAGYSHIPFKATRTRVKVGKRNMNVVVNVPDTRYEFPEYNPTNFMYSSDRDYNYPGEFNETKAMWYALGTPPEEFLTSNINRAPAIRKSLGLARFNAVMGLAAGDILERALAGTGDIKELPYVFEDLLPMFDRGTPPEEILIRYFLGTGYSIGMGFQNGRLGNIESPYDGSLVENIKNKFDLTSETIHPKVIKMINDLCDMFEKYAPKAQKWLDKYNVAERAQNGQLIIGDNKDLLDAVRKLANDFEVSRQEANDELTKTGVKDFINKNGKPLYHPIYVAARLKDGVASFNPDSISALDAADAYIGADIDEVPEAERDVMTGSKGDFGFIHIPAGTKVSRILTPSNYNPGNAYVQWVVSLDSGVEKDNGEFYLNHPNGASYRPSKDEYDPSTYFLHKPRMSEGGHRYKQWEEDYLSLNPEKEGISNFYNVVSPGGTINDLNGELRRKKYAGKIPSDSLLARVNDVIRSIDEVIAEKDEDEPAGITFGSLLSRMNALIQGRVDYYKGGSNTYISWDTTRGIQDNKGLFKKLNSIREELKNTMDASADGYYAELRKKPGMENLSQGEFDQYYKGYTGAPDSVVSWLEKELLETAVEFDDQIPKGILDDFVDINTLGREGTHTVKEGPMPWVMRGTGLSQNYFNNSSDVYNSIADWKVGKSFDANSIDFYSVNPANPFLRQYQSSYGNNNFVISLGLAPGVKVFSYADTDKAFHTEGTDLHRGDGGAITLAYGTRITPVSIRKEKSGPVHIIAIATPAGKDYDGPLDKKGYNEVKRVFVKEDEVIEETGNFVVSAYGMPFEYFPTAEEALDFASTNDVFKVHELSDEEMALDRPPVETETFRTDPLLLAPGVNADEAMARFNSLIETLPALEDSPIDYTRGVIDMVKQVRTVYQQVNGAVNLDAIYQRYALSIYNDTEMKLSPDEKRAIKPLSEMLDKLGHYFDPSGKSLTQGFYLPTGTAGRNKVKIEDALLGNDGVIDEESPVDGGLMDILIDPDRIGDSGFWQKRTGDLFRDAEGNFTMAKSGTLEENLTAYTVSALTRGKGKLAFAVNNEVAHSKSDRNRSQITAKQAYAGLMDADTIRTKTRAYQLGVHKDAVKLAELKQNYTGDESTIDQALKAKNYSKDLNYTNSLNIAAQKLGYNQFLEMTPIAGSTMRFGTQGTKYKGTTNIRRKIERINITGTMWKYDLDMGGHWVNHGFGLEQSEANIKKYGDFKADDAVNLGKIVTLNLEADQQAMAFYTSILEKYKNYWAGDPKPLTKEIDAFARNNFPLHTNVSKYSSYLLRDLARNYRKYGDDVEAAGAANVDSISRWIRRGTLICFNNAIMMTDISNLDNRTIEALDDAASYMMIGAPLKRSKTINFLQEWSIMAALSNNAKLVIGNIGAEIFTRLPGYIGVADTGRALARAMDRGNAKRIDKIIGDLPLHFDDTNKDIVKQANNFFKQAKTKVEDASLIFLNWSEKVKNRVYYAAGEINAERKGITDPVAKQQEALRFVAEHAIAGGKGTTPGVAEGSLGRTFFIFKTFTVRNFDDFVDFVEKASRGESGDNYWDDKYEKKYQGKTDKAGRNAADIKMAARMIGGRFFRSYIFWLLVGSYFGKNFLDALGGDPTGILEGGYDRGLYDDPDTEEYEGMTDFDNFINNIPAGFILGTLQDLYFAARRRGIESKQFFGLDIFNDPKLAKSLESKLPLGVAKNRLSDMLSLLDRGYSFSGTGRKTYAAPETAWDVAKGMLFGKSTTANSLAYGKYRYGTVNIWGDLSSGDWLDFAINANPLTDIMNNSAKFDTTRKDYTGVFDGTYNDIATMQLIIAGFRERNKKIIAEYQEDKYRYSGEWQNLTDAEKIAKAKEKRDKKINEYTNDVQRAVDEFQKAGNVLDDKQITTLMYLFDFHEGEEDDEYNSSVAHQRYVEAGLPDYGAANINRTTVKENGEKKEKTQNILDRSLILKNAQQGYYGSSKEAANAVKDALSDFKSTYNSYKERVKALNDKYFTARNKNKKSAETKQLSKDLEKLQNEYLDKLFDKISPVAEQYGTALIGTYDVADVLQDYMSNMIPYSSIKKYGQTYSSGNDIVYGQLAEWLQKRLGRNAPTAPSDKEITNGISDINKLLNEGRTAVAKSRAKALLEKVGRGSLGARRDDVEKLRDVAYGR